MNWIYGLVAVITILIIGIIQYYRGGRLKPSILIMFIAVILTFLITKYYAVPFYQMVTFESQVKKEPLFSFLAKESPKAFQNYIDKAREDIFYNESKNIIGLTNDFIVTELINNMPYASDKSLYEIITLTTGYYKQLYAIDPTLILFAEFPDKFTNVITMEQIEKISQKSLDKLNEARKNILMSAVENPHPKLSTEDVMQANHLVSAIFDSLVEKYGEQTVIQTFEHPDSPSLDKKIAATIIMDYYEKLQAQGEKNAALVLRYLATQ